MKTIRGCAECSATGACGGVFRLRAVPFGGDGIHQDVSEGDWDAVRRRTYEGRGE